jgi:hypothetical protein
MRRLAEGSPELVAEVRGREVRGARECRHVEPLAVAGVDEILCAEKVPDRVDGHHRSSGSRERLALLDREHAAGEQDAERGASPAGVLDPRAPAVQRREAGDKR